MRSVTTKSGQAGERCLGGTVGGGHVVVTRAGRADVDHESLALGDQLGGRQSGGHEGGSRPDLHHVVPTRDRGLPEGRVGVEVIGNREGVVDENVEFLALGAHPLEEGFHLAVLPVIADHGDRLASQAFRLLHAGLEAARELAVALA